MFKEKGTDTQQKHNENIGKRRNGKPEDEKRGNQKVWLQKPKSCLPPFLPQSNKQQAHCYPKQNFEADGILCGYKKGYNSGEFSQILGQPQFN